MLSLGSLNLASFTMVIDGSPACWYPESSHNHEVGLVERFGFALTRSYEWLLNEAVRGDVPVARRREGLIPQRDYNPGDVAIAVTARYVDDPAFLDREFAKRMRNVVYEGFTVNGVDIPDGTDAEQRAAVERIARGES